MHRKLAILAAMLLLGVPSLAWSQGVLIDIRPDHPYRLPRPPMWPRPVPLPGPVQSYKVQNLAMQVNLVDQVAKVQVTQTFANTGSQTMEVCFVFPLPYDGAVDRMTFMVDGKELEAKLMSAEEARRIFESYVRRNRDPALVEWLGTGMFQTSVFPVPPGASRSVVMRYSQLCRKTDGLTDLLIPLSTARYTSQPVESVTVDVTVQSQQPIMNVYSPTHPVQIQRPSKTSAHVMYSVKNEIPTADFRLLYDVGKQSLGASVLSYRPKSGEDGYFLMLLSPEIKRASTEVTKKTVVFVVDRSGSMSGKKIEQAKGALRFVLNNLQDGDLFNIVAYDTAVESFRPELQRYNADTRNQALGFIEGLYAGGSTNIDGALKTALAQLQDKSRPSYVLFLTDGLPTTGERNESKIVDNMRQENPVHARIFAFGVGYDVNSRLLDKLAREGFGQSQYVRPDEDIEEHVSKLYSRIGAPVMTDVAIQFDVEGHSPDKGPVVNRVYPKQAYDLFAGDQLVMVGRYKQAGAAKVIVSGKVGDSQQSIDFPATLVESSADETFGFIEKLWALRRVGEIIDEIDLHGKNDELVNELVALATQHGILTPYTSFLADETTNIRDVAGNFGQANKALDALQLQTEGRGGFTQRLGKGDLQRATQLPAGIGGGGYGGYPATSRAAATGAAGPVAGRPGATPAGNPQIVTQNVQNIGNKTFYWRDNRWVDSAVTPDQEKSVKHIERYSKEYFDLLRRLGKDVGKYLVLDQDMTIVLDGQAYAF